MADDFASAPAVAVMNDQMAAFLEMKQREVDALYQRIADSLSVTLFKNSGGAIAEELRRAPLELPAGVNPAAVVALTTFCALEWLRHRKAEVALAEADGDMTSLIAEFVEWLRAFLRGLMGARESTE